MKKIYIVAMSMIALASFNLANAATMISKKTEASFDVGVTAVNKIVNTNDTLFTFGLKQIKNPENIAYWKIRLTCPNKVSIKVNALHDDSCGKAVRIEKEALNSFSLLYSNLNNKGARFSFKLKAYDKNGKWLHSEQESFLWK